jgi:hypothetical protein
MDFIGKTVKHVVANTDGLTPVKVIWEDGQLKAKRTNGDIFPIHAWDHLLGRTTIYSLPTNSAHIPWTEKTCKPHHSRPDLVKMFWGKYKSGMTLRGVIKDNEFYESYI